MSSDNPYETPQHDAVPPLADPAAGRMLRPDTKDRTVGLILFGIFGATWAMIGNIFIALRAVATAISLGAFFIGVVGFVMLMEDVCQVRRRKGQMKDDT